MALILCPECKRPISSTADACPRCGAKLTSEVKAQLKLIAEKNKKNFRIGCGLVLAIPILLILICGIENISKNIKESQTKSENEKKYEVMHQDEKSFNLGKPQALCNLFMSVGFKRQVGWSFDSSGSSFRCEYQRMSPAQGGAGEPPNTMEVNALSEDSSKVTHVNLSATINQHDDSAVINEYLRYNKKLFIFLKRDIPDGLLAAISKKHNLSSKTQFGLVEFRVMDKDSAWCTLNLHVGPLGDTLIFKAIDKLSSEGKL